MNRKYDVIRATEALVASVASDPWYSDMVVGDWEIRSAAIGYPTYYYGNYKTKKAAESDAVGLRRSMKGDKT